MFSKDRKAAKVNIFAGQDICPASTTASFDKTFDIDMIAVHTEHMVHIR